MWNAMWSGDFPRAALGMPELRAIRILEDNAACPECMLNYHEIAIPSVAPAAPVSVWGPEVEVRISRYRRNVLNCL
jgi:hypothetical protein